MKVQDALRSNLAMSQNTTTMFLSDLSDADLLVRPVPAANHIAWQLGHLICTEVRMAEFGPAFKYPALPAGFAERHTKETAMVDPPKGFSTKEQYLSLFNATRQATIAALDKLSAEDLDKPTSGSMAKWAPTLGDMLVLIANHGLMHGGQFTVVRRKLGKPVLF
jgi:hypothetical protein